MSAATTEVCQLWGLRATTRDPVHHYEDPASHKEDPTGHSQDPLQASK